MEHEGPSRRGPWQGAFSGGRCDGAATTGAARAFFGLRPGPRHEGFHDRPEQGQDDEHGEASNRGRHGSMVRPEGGGHNECV